MDSAIPVLKWNFGRNSQKGCLGGTYTSHQKFHFWCIKQAKVGVPEDIVKMAALCAMSPLKEVPADLHLLDAAQAGKLRITDPLKSFVQVGVWNAAVGLSGQIPSGKLTKLWKITISIGKSTINSHFQ